MTTTAQELERSVARERLASRIALFLRLDGIMRTLDARFGRGPASPWWQWARRSGLRG